MFGKHLRSVAMACAMATSVQAMATPLATGPFRANTDFAMFGISGLRGTGNGTITVSGLSGTVTRAVLIWHGISTSATAVGTQSLQLAGTPYTGNNIGISANNCWGFNSSQAYAVDVTPTVSGNGSYAITSSRTASFDPNGASLLVFFNDGNASNNQDVAVFWGNDSNQTNSFDPAGWQASLSGINYTSGAASMTLVVSDGQDFIDGTSATINGSPYSVPDFAGNTLPVAPGSTVTNGGLWDHHTGTVTSYLTPGPNTLNFNARFPLIGETDCLSLIAAAFQLPAGTVTPPPSTTISPAAPIPTTSATALGGTALALAVWGLYGLRRRDKKPHSN